MSVEGKIGQIFYSFVPEEVENPNGGRAMVELTNAELVAGNGIRTLGGNKDRYYGEKGENLRGAYPNNKIRQLSLITQDAIDRANKNREVVFSGLDTRRNIVIDDMSAEELNSLVERLIELGAVELQGTELCDPCDRPSSLSGKTGFKSAFTNDKGESIGGLRVEILTSGSIRIGDSVSGKS